MTCDPCLISVLPTGSAAFRLDLGSEGSLRDGGTVTPKLLITPPSPPLISSEGTEEPVKVREAGDGVFECEYYPVVPGKYVVTITWGGYAIPRR